MLSFEPLEADAPFGLGFFAEQLEDPLDVVDVRPGLLEMALEAAPELLVGDLVDQLRERLLGEGPLDLENVAELVQEQVARCRDLGHEPSFRSRWNGRSTQDGDSVTRRGDAR